MRLYIFFTSLFAINIVFSQTGPSGIGTAANNILWLKADQGTSTTINGAPISGWNDQSGNGINVTQTISVQQPSFATNIINGNPAVQFDNVASTNDKMIGPDSPILDNTAAYTFFTVTRPQTVDGAARVILSKRTTVSVDQSFMLFYYSANKFFVDIQTTNNRFNSASTFSSNNNYIIDVVYDGSLPAASRSKLYIGETLDVTATESSAFLPDNASPLIIGSTDASDTRPYGGYIAEVIIYRTALNPASRIIVNNYLSSKYDIALSANDKYAGDTPANGDYDYEVCGIGNESTGSSNTFSASVSGGIGISNVSGFDNGDYILVGHASTTNNVITTDVSGMTGPYNARWSRIWFVDVTNSANDLINTIEFDNSDGGVSGLPLGVASNYVLLYRSGLSGSWTELTTATAISGDKVQFTNVNLTTDGYYTIGTKNYNASPLPIELLSFDAIMNEKRVDINWTTATEINNDYYTVEKSRDGVNFDPVSIVKAAGNSNTLKQYTDVDYSPFDGISYYRLKQTDFNLTVTYSKMVAVNYIIKDDGITMFPNPTQGDINLSIKGLHNQPILVVIRDAIGKECYSKVVLTEENNNIIALDTEGILAKGTYIVVASSNNKLYSQKIIVK